MQRKIKKTTLKYENLPLPGLLEVNANLESQQQEFVNPPPSSSHPRVYTELETLETVTPELSVADGV